MSTQDTVTVTLNRTQCEALREHLAGLGVAHGGTASALVRSIDLLDVRDKLDAALLGRSA